MKFVNLSKKFTILSVFFGVLAFGQFPDDFRLWVHYNDFERGDVLERMYIQKEAIKAVKNGQNLPDQTIIMLEELYTQSAKKGEVRRYITMQKNNKKWKFYAFNADKSPNLSDTKRCLNCHQDSLDREDIVFTLENIKNYQGNLE